MKVAIRVDASLQIGTGHVMRCMTLADQLKKKGAEVLFICRQLPGNIINIIEGKKYRVASLPMHISKKTSEIEGYEKWLGVSRQQDAEETCQVLLKEGEVDWLVVDHYAIEQHWEAGQRNIVSKILVIDDLADRAHDCDMLVDQNFYENFDSRYKQHVSNKCKLLLGPKYSLLRSEFANERKHIRVRDGHVHRVLIFFGGIDFSNMTGRVVEAISNMAVTNDIAVDVVIGATNPNIKNIESICSQNKSIFLHVQVENMAELMSRADLCIGSGGTVTWERCCLGLPSFVWPVAENQKKLLADAAKAGLVYALNREPSVDNISMHFSSLIQNPSLCLHLSNEGMNLIDGKGADRIANLMLKQVVDVRPAISADMHKVYAWRNDSNVRKYSHSMDEIDFDQHEKWFEAVLKDKCRPLFIGIAESDEIGVLRFDINKNKAEISIYLAPEQQGYGYGASLIAAGEKWLKKEWPDVISVIAEVLPNNRASVKLFETSGYNLSGLQYEKSIKQ